MTLKCEEPLSNFAFNFNLRRCKLVAQAATGEMCDQVLGNYIRGAFVLTLAEDSQESNGKSAKVLSGSVFGAMHCDGHHYTAVMRNDIKAVEMGQRTKDILRKTPVIDSGVSRDSAAAAFTKQLIQASQEALPSYPKFDLKVG